MPQSPLKLKVVIVDDHAMFTDGFQLLLNRLGSVEVVGVYSTVDKYIKNIDSKQFDIAFMDIEFKMGTMNGVEATIETLKRRPNVKVIAVSMHDGGPKLEEMIKAGALGFVPKYVSADKIKTAISKVCRGELYVAPSVAANYMSTIVNSVAKEPGGEEANRPMTKADFTPQELNIMQYSADGMCDKEIAEKLSLKKKHVDYEKTKLYKKLDVRNVSEMVAMAVRLKLIS